MYEQVPPSNGLVGAILATLFCCMPFGVVAIVYAAQVDSAWTQGNVELAYSNAEKAKNWTVTSVVCGLIAIVVYVIVVAVAVLSAR